MRLTPTQERALRQLTNEEQVDGSLLTIRSLDALLLIDRMSGVMKVTDDGKKALEQVRK